MEFPLGSLAIAFVADPGQISLMWGTTALAVRQWCRFFLYASGAFPAQEPGVRVLRTEDGPAEAVKTA